MHRVMARAPFAVWRPLTPENYTQAEIVPTQALVHSAAVDVRSLYDYFMRSGVGVESHAFAKFDGSVEQYMDTSRKADANFGVNRRWDGEKFVGAISLETEDRRDPDTRPWTDEQVRGIIAWFEWCIQTHGIPRRECRSWSDPGLGFHAQFPQWSNVRGKTCPGLIRQVQWRNIILPALLNPTSYTSAVVKKEYANVFTVPESQGLSDLDPVSGGLWIASPDGAVFANHGAPYLGGYNAYPEWGAGEHPRKCIGLHAVEIDGEWGYALAFDDASLYRFHRDGRLVKA